VALSLLALVSCAMIAVFHVALALELSSLNLLLIASDVLQLT
jgi:hypothetical protein